MLQHSLFRFTRCWSNIASCQAFPASRCCTVHAYVSTMSWFAVGEGSRSAISHHTSGGHYSLRGCVFWISGWPESLERSVLWSACWEEGGNCWRQWVRVSQLSQQNTNYQTFSQQHVISFACAAGLIISTLWGCSSLTIGSTSGLQEKHRRASVVPLLWTSAGEHLHSGAEYPRRQPRQPEEGFGCRTSGLRCKPNQINKNNENAHLSTFRL